MSAMAHNLPHKHLLSVKEYQRMGDAGVLSEGIRVELIKGEIIDMAPIGSRHASFVMQLNHFFMSTLSNQLQVSVQSPILLDEYSAPEPDLMLLLPRQDFYREHHPGPNDAVLIVEVSMSSLEYDRNVKIPLYATAGISEVWLVDVATMMINRFSEPDSGRYHQIDILDHAAKYPLISLPEIELDLSELFTSANK